MKFHIGTLFDGKFVDYTRWRIIVGRPAGQGKAMPASSSSSPAVVLLHGIGGAARIWAPQMAAFADAGFEPVALDLPGYGVRPPIHAIDFDMLAADVEAAIAARGLDRPVLLGHSMGGMIVQRALRRRPDGYRAAVLACTSPAFGNPDGDFQQKFVAARLAPLDAGKTMADLAPKLVDAMMGPDPDPVGRAYAVDVMGRVPSDTYRAVVRCLVTFDERAGLSAIRVPTLCLACDKDPNAPASMMERVAGKIAGARYVCLPNLGHLPNLEAPAAFDAAVLDFLRDTFRPAST
jgi:3-oxoadipate enol-lactonase